jgi:hypothetical protein
MYSVSINCSFASGSVSIKARASSSVFASTRKITPLPSPREYHSRIFAVEVELHGCPNLGRDNVHDLDKGDALFGSLNNQHCSGFRYSYAGQA